MEYTRELVELIVQLILDSIRDTGGTKRILALFTGGLGGAGEARDAIGSLSDEGHQIRAMFTENAERVNGKNWLLERAPQVVILDRDPSASPKSLLQETDLVLIPILTYNSAAKLAHGMADNPVLTAALFARIQGMPVIAAEDACAIPESPACTGLFRKNRLALEALGIRFVRASGLTGAVKEGPTGLPLQADGDRFTGTVLSAEAVREWRKPVLSLPEGTIITPSARDMAERRGIRMQFQSL